MLRNSIWCYGSTELGRAGQGARRPLPRLQRRTPPRQAAGVIYRTHSAIVPFIVLPDGTPPALNVNIAGILFVAASLNGGVSLWS